MTTLSATGAGAASQQSLGTVVFGGMLASTLVAIPFVAVFFVAVHGREKKPKAAQLTSEGLHEGEARA